MFVRIYQLVLGRIVWIVQEQVLEHDKPLMDEITNANGSGITIIFKDMLLGVDARRSSFRLWRNSGSIGAAGTGSMCSMQNTFKQ